MSLRRRSIEFSGVLACGHSYRLQGLSGSRLRNRNQRYFIGWLPTVATYQMGPTIQFYSQTLPW
jgi:hypothetical protein